MSNDPDRFFIRPDIDPNDEGAVKDLAKALTDWALAKRDEYRKKQSEQDAIEQDSEEKP